MTLHIFNSEIVRAVLQYRQSAGKYPTFLYLGRSEKAVWDSLTNGEPRISDPTCTENRFMDMKVIFCDEASHLAVGS